MTRDGHPYPVIDVKACAFIELLFCDKQLNQVFQPGFVAVGELVIDGYVFLEVAPPGRREGLLQFAPASPVAVEKQVEDRRRRSEEHTSELQSRPHLVCRLLLEK